MLRGMFSKCGDGVFIMRMDNNDRFRICRVDGDCYNVTYPNQLRGGSGVVICPVFVIKFISSIVKEQR